MQTFKTEKISNELVGIMYEELFLSRDKSTYGYKLLKQQVIDSITCNQPLKFLLPAFPCKSISAEKCLSDTPDMAEWLALKKIVSTIRKIEEVYEHGVKFTIFSDYHTFSKYISVEAKSYYRYREGLKKIINAFNCDGALELKSLSDHEAFASYNDDEQMDILWELYGDETYESTLDKVIATDSSVRKKYISLKKFMGDDQKALIGSLGKSKRNKRISEIARGMMTQGVALDNFLHQTFPHHIRLSIHHHPDESAKHTLQLFDKSLFKTPWHNCVTFSAATGKYLIDRRNSATCQGENHQSIISPIYFEDRAWLLLELPTPNPNSREYLKKIKFSLRKEDFALFIESTSTDLNISEISNIAISNLLNEFGILIFRNLKTFETVNDLESWYSGRGQFLEWSFGATHIVKPELETQGYTSSVTSEEALPFHWDMVSPPPYMKIDQTKHKYHEYTPKEFLLYCKSNESSEGGLSTIINSSMVPLTINGRKRKAFRETTLAYRTRLSYFGGTERNYPLIMTVPGTEKELLRWWQMWDEESHPGSVQFNYSRILESPLYDDITTLEKEITAIALNDANHLTLEFRTGDIVLVNNHTVLHGRTAFKGHRELWRIQLQPELPAVQSTVREV
ncbi:L-tyrosine/L-tryptophan isonitrile synthase family protein [Pseudomonas sp. CCM 7893]|uniref:L-tyrosine/L-tryptophan isonitrile synthase family protein n=1 Tax=Pseudomonas spelaei TaxID=1055469 RepID=A0A6I3W6R2_9PSED|nr:L-tyrosine/L-tryptophan isonitrile synthase family protein [Pseudomonas spelaei]MUF03581.1 L-tyrosine/L-tryptophan isonitrile synthase family protein [Pseudomonas spelaei]